MIAIRWSTAVFLAILGVLAACSLPQGAGQTRQILEDAESPEANFAVYPVTKGFAATIASWPGTGASGSGISGWIARSRGPAGNIIEAGDKLDITIWESGEGSLLSNPGEKVVSMTGLTVSPDGSVFLPYLSRVYVAKMGPDEARETIQKQLEPVVPAAQVLIGHTPGRKSSVDAVSGVSSPGSYPMPDRDFTVMALLAQAGGVPESITNPQVRVVRDGKLYGISMDRLLKDPSLDSTLRGGDKVYVEGEERYFLALGAAGREAQVPFTQERITALDAMALVGGLNDARADPRGILVLRDYAASAVRADGQGPTKQRVVFTIDLTSADGLFSAGEFPVHDRDLVLVTETPVTTTQTVFGLIGGVLGVANSTQSVAN